ncbi:hypothetical protein QQF64_016007 [Cirrhinus molitorella]|uniref:Uncharacterized protein n=1 Tax=Cirrhinus molitorella TaxID=172907 RepID=A0ABR3LLL4_9TELE
MLKHIHAASKNLKKQYLDVREIIHPGFSKEPAPKAGNLSLTALWIRQSSSSSYRWLGSLSVFYTFSSRCRFDWLLSNSCSPMLPNTSGNVPDCFCIFQKIMAGPFVNIPSSHINFWDTSFGF